MHWQRKRQHDSNRSFKAVKASRINKQPTNALTLHAPILQQFPERLCRLVNASYAAYGGAQNMRLDDWRDLELELKRRIGK